jgi:hypothetical protein
VKVFGAYVHNYVSLDVAACFPFFVAAVVVVVVVVMRNL